MKTLTITMPDDVLCVALTTVAIKGTAIHTFTNCFSVKGEENIDAEIFETKHGYELRTEETP